MVVKFTLAPGFVKKKRKKNVTILSIWDLENPTHLKSPCRERGRRRRRRNTGVVETIIAQIGLARLLLGLLANIRFQ